MPSTTTVPHKPKDWSPVVIAGPSGVGKGTLINSLHRRHPGLFTKCISHTTRSPRTGEVDGHDYHFVSCDDFTNFIHQDAFIEHTEFSGNLYGTSKAALEKHANGQVLLLDIDVNGVEALSTDKILTVKPRYVFVRTKNIETLEKRLRGRGTENEDKIQQRLDRAQQELAVVESKPSLFGKVIYNDDLEDAVHDLEALIIE